MTRLLSIDGNWLARAKFEGNGRDVFGCVDSFMESMESFIEDFEPESVAVAWDSAESVRKVRMPSYKAQRPPAPEGFTDALRQIKKRLKGENVYQFSCDGWEGDDVLATIAKTMPGPHTVVSVDKDLFQLVAPGVTYYRVNGDGDPYTIRNIKERTGLLPWEWTSYLSLCGDTADNIKGVPGIGDVKARRLLSHYPEIVQSIISNERREDAVQQARDFGDKEVAKLVEKCAEHHSELAESWLAVRLNDDLKLKVVMPNEHS